VDKKNPLEPAKTKATWLYPVTALAILALFTGGQSEQFAEELFAPVREKGGWGEMMGVKPPGADEAKVIKVRTHAQPHT